MSKTKNIALAAFVLLAPLTLCLAQESVNVSGEWDLTINTPRGEMTSTAKFVQEGEKLTVTMISPRGESTGTGTIKGADIEWTVTRETPRGQMTITYKGKVEGNTMKGEAQMGDFGTAEWKAAKKTA
ncbi:MAG: hypothetical protein A2V45_16680 [Candidatus Aminicenantes bacterium RBG_19FT_COMBO_58_17]|jgi:hypothetical protein|nr:MAG: hypothetical protein A2V45_16680 [Candidatus Aminicenantes bacterium RBG_19FT_COMBO_58_17]HCS48504.1 hypothetical protein [Candidatus Aminicenantes bacterium]